MQHWTVTVEKDGEKILTIESNCLSGKADLTSEDEQVIRNAAEHLLSFVGAVKSDTGCDDDRLDGDADDWRKALERF